MGLIPFLDSNNLKVTVLLQNSMTLAVEIVHKNQNYLQHISRWNKFEHYCYEHHLDFETLTPCDVNAFLLHISLKSAHLYTYHWDKCPKDNCDCPVLGSVRNIEAYRSSIRLLFNERCRGPFNPVNSLECDSLIYTLKKLKTGNRLMRKQALKLESTVITSTLNSFLIHIDFETSSPKKFELMRNVLFVGLLFYSGSRFSDISRLRWSDISCLSSTELKFFITHTKYPNSNNECHIESRNISFDIPSLFSRYKDFCYISGNICKTGKIFVNWKSLKRQKGSGVIQVSTINSFVKSLFGPNVSSHSFRVSRACELFNSSGNLGDVQTQLRLKSLSMASHYSKQAFN